MAVPALPRNPERKARRMYASGTYSTDMSKTTHTQRARKYAGKKSNGRVQNNGRCEQDHLVSHLIGPQQRNYIQYIRTRQVWVIRRNQIHIQIASLHELAERRKFASRIHSRFAVCLARIHRFGNSGFHGRTHSQGKQMKGSTAGEDESMFRRSCRRKTLGSLRKRQKGGPQVARRHESCLGAVEARLLHPRGSPCHDTHTGRKCPENDLAINKVYKI
jgi:hypothetical protein